MTSVEQHISELEGKLESPVGKLSSVFDAQASAQFSIAISLKRIADLLSGSTDPTTGNSLHATLRDAILDGITGAR